MRKGMILRILQLHNRRIGYENSHRDWTRSLGVQPSIESLAHGLNCEEFPKCKWRAYRWVLETQRHGACQYDRHCLGTPIEGLRFNKSLGTFAMALQLK